MKDIILFDGGMGQELVKRNQSADHPLWSAKVLLDNFDLVKNLHKDFINSGSTVITTNSYSCTPQRLRKYNYENEFENLQKLAIKAAKQAIRESKSKENIKIAGCVSPLPGSYYKDENLRKEEIIDTYVSIGDLQKDDVDFFLVETMASIEDAKNTIKALSIFNKKIVLCFCLSEGDGTKLFSGEDLKHACDILDLDKVHGLCVNCSQIEDIYTALKILKNYNLPIGAFPNNFVSIKPLKLGMSVDNIKKRNDIFINDFINHAKSWLELGCLFLGGCCEISPVYIKGIDKYLVSNGYNKINEF